MIDFLGSARTQGDLIAMAQEHGFLDAEGMPVPGTDWDPTPGSPAWEAGIPIAPPEDFQGEWLPEFHFNLRCSGAVAADQIEGIPQEDKGELLPLRRRTKWGLAMTEGGMSWISPNGHTTGVSNQSVTFIDPESIGSRQRVWQ